MEDSMVLIKRKELEHIREYLLVLKEGGEVPDDWNGFLCCWIKEKHKHELILGDYRFVAYKSTSEEYKRTNMDYGIMLGDSAAYYPKYTEGDSYLSFDLTILARGTVTFTSDKDCVPPKPIVPRYVPANETEKKIWDVLQGSDLSTGMKIVTLQTMLTQTYTEWISTIPKDERWDVLDSVVDSNDTLTRSLMKFAEGSE